MLLEPEIKLLSYQKRRSFFLLLLAIFCITLPLFIFYTSGYRLSFDNEKTTIVTTGGIYITSESEEVDVYLDDEQVQRPRLFRSAYYIQNIETGIHRVVVQQPGLHTWVKNLPVDPYIVTEAAAFNLPVLPHIRIISQYVNNSGQAVLVETSTSTNIFSKATTTNEYLVVTRLATSTVQLNQEFDYVKSLFSTTTTQETPTVLERIGNELENLSQATTSNGTTTPDEPVVDFIEEGNMRLMLREDELVAVWAGSIGSIPHYFCTNDAASTTLAVRLGEHVARQIEVERVSTTTPLLVNGPRVCRNSIRIDRKWQTIKYHAFFPGIADLVVLQLEDGLYVTEIDDRSWQNTQLIYPGDEFNTVVTDDSIFIEENGRYFELLTDISELN